MKSKKAKKTFTPSTLEDRIEFLRKSILSTIQSHGAPCLCILCESLQFDYLAMEGKINLKTGERKPE
jgi:hypothetical protein